MDELDHWEAVFTGYEHAAQHNANGFWCFAVIAAVVWYFWGVWAAVPGSLAVAAMGVSFYCTMKATKARRHYAFWKARLDAIS